MAVGDERDQGIHAGEQAAVGGWHGGSFRFRPQQAFARYAALRRPRVERIIKVAARINSNKTAGPVTRVFRDAVLPVILRLTTNSKQVNQQYRYHIDWDTPTSSVTA